MSLLSKATKGIQEVPPIHLVYGPNGTGKTTFAAGFPKHLILDIEKGSNRVAGANRIQELETLKSFQDTLKELVTAQHGFKSVAIDTVEALEGLIFAAVCEEGGVKSIEEFGGGFGKGFMRSREIMREIMMTLQNLAKKKDMTVLLLAHSQTKPHTDPISNTAWDRYILRTNDKMASIVKDLCDNVFFVSPKILSAKSGNKEIAVSDNKNYMYTQWRTAFDAKNRMNLPFEIEFNYPAFAKACESARPVTVDQLKAETMPLIAGLLDKETRTKAEESLKKATTLEAVAAVKTRIETLVHA